MRELVEALFRNIPSGVGSRRKDLRLSREKQDKVLKRGARWAVEKGYGLAEDVDHIEQGGAIEGADPGAVSQRALERGRGQLGTLGSGNHFVEVDYVAEVFDQRLADALRLEKGQVTVTVHTGSRGLGHQVCDDYIKVMLQAAAKYGIELPDRQLCCAPIGSNEGKRYWAAMACAANFAFANRQMITHWVRETFERVMGMGPKQLQLDLIYDVCHNIAKFEEHEVDGRRKRVCVHSVLIPGDMGRCSYVLVGTEKAFRDTFGSTCHGAGRVMSRHQAKRAARGRAIVRELEDKGIIVRAAGRTTLVEEISEAYKDVTDVVDVVHHAGIGTKVVKLVPMGVIKG
jgi:tRNA-splicing ligase RtcB